MREIILVTGCSGFLGSHMCSFLLKKNYKVFGIDNLLTGNKKNIESFFNNKNFHFKEHDVCDEIHIDSKVTKIIHLASPASPKDYLKHPIKTLQTGSYGTENILKLALTKKATVLVASSSEVYGDPMKHPQDENYFGNVNCTGPRAVYDEAKRYLEAITMAYHKKFNVDTKIARIFNTYGPNMKIDDGRAIPNFINQAINNNDITIYGNGEQTRSFCYVDDTILGLYKLLNSKYNSPFNIGNPKEFSIISLAKKIQELIPCRSNLVFCNLPVNDPKIRKPDIQKAQKKLKWNPKINLDSGLKKTITYFRKIQ